MICKLRDFFPRQTPSHGWIKLLSSARPVILTYHGIPFIDKSTTIDAEIFERHIVFLREYFEIVAPRPSICDQVASDKPRIALTFDDGFRNQAEVVAPILRRHHIPALFFVSSRHCSPGRYLWFSYLEALGKYFRGKGFYVGGEFIDMSPDKRHENMLALRQTLLSLEPHPGAMYKMIDNELPRLEDFVGTGELADQFAGMTAEQVGELASDSLFSVGVHTVDHPFLTKCTADESRCQILDNKMWIEAISNQRCTSIAYPGGMYNAETIKQCRSLGLTAGYALVPTLNADIQYELQRIGVYSRSLGILGLKVKWGNLTERVRFQVTGRI